MANPLTPQDMASIEEMLLKLNDAKDIIRRGKQAGFDMTAQEQQEKEQREKLLKIKQAFAGS